MLAIGTRYAFRKRDFKRKDSSSSSFCLITFSFLFCSHSFPFPSYRSLLLLLFLSCSSFHPIFITVSFSFSSLLLSSLLLFITFSSPSPLPSVIHCWLTSLTNERIYIQHVPQERSRCKSLFSPRRGKHVTYYAGLSVYIR